MYAYIIQIDLYVYVCVCERHVDINSGSEPPVFRVTLRNSSKTSRRKHQVISWYARRPRLTPFVCPSPAAPLYVPDYSLGRPVALLAPSPFPARSGNAPKRALSSSRVDAMPSPTLAVERCSERSFQLASPPVHRVGSGDSGWWRRRRCQVSSTICNRSSPLSCLLV